MTCQEIINRLTKAKRKFDVCENHRHAILYCKNVELNLVNVI